MGFGPFKFHPVNFIYDILIWIVFWIVSISFVTWLRSKRRA
jgi:hypothetical protein